MRVQLSLKIVSLVSLSLFHCAKASPLSLITGKSKPSYDLKSGDIVFQDTGGAQGAAVQAATKSNFTHCGVVFEENGKLYVIEALEPVTITPILQWKRRSSVYHAMRLKNPKKLTPAILKKALNWGVQQVNKPYDFKFQWDDANLYCSELVWKLYAENAGIRLCEPKSFHSYFLDKPEVRKIIRLRYGAIESLPKNEPVVAPSDIAKSALLVEVPRKSKKSSIAKKR